MDGNVAVFYSQKKKENSTQTLTQFGQLFKEKKRISLMLV